MCIKINLKQTALARLFSFVIYGDKFLSCIIFGVRRFNAANLEN